MAEPEIQGPFPYEMSPEMDAKVTAMTEQADADVEASREEMRVSMRWGKAQVELVKRAAALFGMPYQTYVKQAAMRQAIADLRDLGAVVGQSGDQAE